jgi:hypothetical protein
VLVEGRHEYTYTIGSAFDEECFLALLVHHPGTALNFLKKNKIGKVVKK